MCPEEDRIGLKKGSDFIRFQSVKAARFAATERAVPHLGRELEIPGSSARHMVLYSEAQLADILQNPPKSWFRRKAHRRK
jgi:hypothetical protein